MVGLRKTGKNEQLNAAQKQFLGKLMGLNSFPR